MLIYDIPWQGEEDEHEREREDEHEREREDVVAFMILSHLYGCYYLYCNDYHILSYLNI